MTYQPRHQRDAAEADRQASGRRGNGHPMCCRCFCCVSRETYLAETALWREANERGDPPPIRGQMPGGRT